MPKKLIQKTIITTVAAVALGATALLAATSTTSATEDKVTSSPTSSAEKLTSSILKDETIYVFTKSSGEIRKVITSDWTENALGLDEYNNFESTTADGNSAPIDLKISYTLDGKSISADDLAGKSGKVKIRFEYENRETEIVSGQKMYLPYVVVSGLLLDNDHFKNVEVENAKLFNDGSRTVIASIALPGMQENLNLNKSDFEIPSSFEITVDATDFELGMTMSVATSELFAELDTDNLNNLDEISIELTDLTDAMTALMDGSAQLYDGLAELNDKSGVLTSGIAKLTTGATELNSGAETLSSGASKVDDGVASVQSGAAALSSGLDELSANSATITAGTKQVLDASLASANTQISALRPVFAAFSLPTDDLTSANYATILDHYITAMDDATVATTLASYGQDAATLKTTFESLKTSLTSLNTLYQGVQAYTSGVDSAAEGAAQLSSGANELKSGSEQLKSGAEALSSGTSELRDGLSTLSTSTPALVEGVSKLKNGSSDLKTGLAEFNRQGIQKLVDFYADDLEGFADRLKSIVDLSKSHTNHVKYLYRTDEIKN